MYDKVFVCILRKCTSKNKIFVYNLARLSRSVQDAAGLVRQLKGLGIELYAPDRSISLEPTPEMIEMIEKEKRGEITKEEIREALNRRYKKTQAERD